MSGLTDEELTALALRYSEHPDSPEWKLVSAFIQLHTCWHCQASLAIDVHQSCENCPEYDESDDEAEDDEGPESEGGAEPGAAAH